MAVGSSPGKSVARRYGAPRRAPAAGSVRSVAHPATMRPGGRRHVLRLPAVAPRVRGGSGRPRLAEPSAAVVRRRRLAAVVLAAVVLALLASAVVATVAPVAGSPAGAAASVSAVSSATTVTVVGAHESLSEVAHRTSPHTDTAAVVERIRELNHLPGVAVVPGRPLVVPAG